MDPFSAASGTAGITSLGIQVCQGLISCYGDWKDFPEDITRATHSVHSLCNILKLLQGSLRNQHLDNARRQQAQECVESCTEGLGELSKKLAKCRKTQPQSGNAQTRWSSLQRSLYPFRKSTIEKLQKIVDDLQSRCLAAVEVLQLDIDIKSLQTLESLETKTEAVQQAVKEVSSENKQLIDLVELEALKKWLIPPDPEVNHHAAQRSRQAETGQWLLHSNQYKGWKAGTSSSKHLWIHGKPGSGKSVLCSTAIDDVRSYSATEDRKACSIFYFTFSDEAKQSYSTFLKSTLFQLGGKDPGYPILLAAHQASRIIQPDDATIEKVLLEVVSAYDEVFLMIDALDESTQGNGVRQSLFDGLRNLTSKATNLKIFMTSRTEDDVQEFTENIKAGIVTMASAAVDKDIERYVVAQLYRDRKLSKLDDKTKHDIRQSISAKADGMFRWAYCQVEALRSLKSLKPKYVREVLKSLPVTLDATYDRILANIEPMFRDEAVVLLKWLAYARSPPTLAELAEASIVNPYGATWVDIENRGSLDDTLRILAGLITVEPIDDKRTWSDYDNNSTTDRSQGRRGGNNSLDNNVEDRPEEDLLIHEMFNLRRDSVDVWRYGSSVADSVLVRLAHFSVKGYLESSLILNGNLKDFHLASGSGHEFLTQSCAVYLLNFSDVMNGRLCRTRERNENQEQATAPWPLFHYAVSEWQYHAGLQTPPKVDRLFDLLKTEAALTCCLSWSIIRSAIYNPGDQYPGLLHAVKYNLNELTRKLLDHGAGFDGVRELESAIQNGNPEIISMLIDRGADVRSAGILSSAGGRHSPNIIKMLVDYGADVNDVDVTGATALARSTLLNSVANAEMLIALGANVNIANRNGRTALHVAAAFNHVEIARLLLADGIDLNKVDGFRRTALHQCGPCGNIEVCETLLQNWPDVNVEDADGKTALHYAVHYGNVKFCQMLIRHRIDLNVVDCFGRTAMHYCALRSDSEICAILIKNLADVNVVNKCGITALHCFALWKNVEACQMLIDAGANIPVEIRGNLQILLGRTF